MLLINTEYLLEDGALWHSSKWLPSRCGNGQKSSMNFACGIPGHSFLSGLSQVHITALGPRIPWEAMTEFKSDLYFQCTLDKGLPALLKSLNSLSREELCAMLSQLKCVLKLLP